MEKKFKDANRQLNIKIKNNEHLFFAFTLKFIITKKMGFHKYSTFYKDLVKK